MTTENKPAAAMSEGQAAEPLDSLTLSLLNDLHGKGTIPNDWPQPYAGIIVLLETLSEIGMTAKRDGAPTANSRLCTRFAADLRAILAAQPAPVGVDASEITQILAEVIAAKVVMKKAGIAQAEFGVMFKQYVAARQVPAADELADCYEGIAQAELMNENLRKYGTIDKPAAQPPIRHDLDRPTGR
jgi:hypothetical protein